MAVTIGLLGADAALRAWLDAESHRMAPLSIRSFDDAAQALSWLREAGSAADVFIIGPETNAPVRIAERAVTIRDGTELLICVRPDQEGAVVEESGRSFLLGDAAPCVSLDKPEALFELLSSLVARARGRRRHRAVVEASGERLALAKPMTLERAHYVEELWKHAPIGVLVVRVERGIVLDCNDRAAEILDIGVDDSILERFSGEDRERLSRALAEPVAATPEPIDLEYARSTSTGGDLRVEVSIAAARDESSRLLLVQDVTARHRAEEELLFKLAVIEEQKREIERLSTPIIQVWEGVLTLPLVGRVDEERAARMMSTLLDAVTQRSARFVIVDLTGVAAVDVATADGLLSMVRATTLLGAKCVLSGISADVARAIVELGLDLRAIGTYPSLYAALRFVLRKGMHAV